MKYSQLADRVERIKTSPTIAIATKAHELQAAGKPIISLSIGEPDFDTPQHIKLAAIKSIQDGYTKYTAVDGIKELKQAIIDKFSRENHLQFNLNQILISCVAKHSLYNLFIAVLSPGDEVMMQSPYWVSYPDMTILAGGNPVIVETDIADQFKMTPDKLSALITNRTRIVIINSPSNPTGMAYSADELKALGEVILDYPDIIVASDEIYEHHLWQHLPYTNMLNVCPELYDRYVLINGASKTYAMTGWRIGYAAGPASIIAAMKKAQSQMTSNPANPSQYAALAALTGDQHCVKIMTDAYHERHDYAIRALQKMPGIDVIPSDGTFYTFPCVKGLLNKNTQLSNDLQLTEFLLNEAEVAVIPGSACGAEGYIRICFTTSMANLKEAMQRIHTAIEKLIK